MLIELGLLSEDDDMMMMMMMMMDIWETQKRAAT
jgi:hypothetical protein